ncbi:MAG: WcaF family extracellular polysaccharide biosynthesis acetyltransferase [Acidobacteriota bacterium]|nr:WcaF family extracellular polysaccharide biosynthesis acetyltransferase [Acidobacteriota bacterium]
MSPVRLADFRDEWYRPGRPLPWQVAWLLLGLPILRSPLLSYRMRAAWLRLFGARIGSGAVIKPRVRVKYPWRLIAGNDCWIGEDCWIDNLDLVRLGNNVCLSQGTYLCTGNQDWSDPSFGMIVKPIVLQDGAWAGARATLAPGVTLGECAIAAAGSVVTRDIPPFEIHAGNPAAFLRRRCVKTGPPSAS